MSSRWNDPNPIENNKNTKITKKTKIGRLVCQDRWAGLVSKSLFCFCYVFVFLLFSAGFWRPSVFGERSLPIHWAGKHHSTTTCPDTPQRRLHNKAATRLGASQAEQKVASEKKKTSWQYMTAQQSTIYVGHGPTQRFFRRIELLTLVPL